MTAKEWNEKYPPGTPVRYYPLIGKDDPPPMDTFTRSEAWNLGHGAPVVLLVGKTGGYSLDHLKARPTGPNT